MEGDRVAERSECTEWEIYRPIMDLINRARRQLITKPTFRAPYLQLLNAIYDTGPLNEQKKIRRLQPRRPTDKDLHLYFIREWPEIRLNKCEDIGFTLVGPSEDNAIYINWAFVKDLREMVRDVYLARIAPVFTPFPDPAETH
jgi:hypothetical protein